MRGATSERRSSGPPEGILRVLGPRNPTGSAAPARLSHRRAPGRRRHRRAHTGVCYQEARCIQVETVAMLSHCDTEYGYPAATVVVYTAQCTHNGYPAPTTRTRRAVLGRGMQQRGPGGADGGDFDVLAAPATCQGQGGTVLPPLGLIPDPRGAPLEPRLGRVAEARKHSALGVRGFDAAPPRTPPPSGSADARPGWASY